MYRKEIKNTFWLSCLCIICGFLISWGIKTSGKLYDEDYVTVSGTVISKDNCGARGFLIAVKPVNPEYKEFYVHKEYLDWIKIKVGQKITEQHIELESIYPEHHSTGGREILLFILVLVSIVFLWLFVLGICKFIVYVLLQIVEFCKSYIEHRQNKKKLDVDKYAID